MLHADKARDVIVQELARAMVEVTEGIADTARLLAPVDRGILRSSIFTEVKPGSGTVFVTGLVATGKQASAYDRAVEFGSRPHWVPIAPLKGWARRVLGDEKAAWAIQRAIARRGTRPHPYFGPAVDEAQREAPTIFRDAHHRIAARLQS